MPLSTCSAGISSSSSSTITPKEALSLLNKVHLFATYNENNDLQHRIDDIITTIKGISIRENETIIDHRLFSLISFLVNVYYDTTFRESRVLLLNIAYIPYSFCLKMPT